MSWRRFFSVAVLYLDSLNTKKTARLKSKDHVTILCRYSWFGWLEYSLQKQAAFCFFCRFFGVTGSGVSGPSGGQVTPVFTSTGYNNWKKALEKKSGFVRHAESKAHLHAEQAYHSWKVSLRLAGIVERHRCSVSSRRESCRLFWRPSNMLVIPPVMAAQEEKPLAC